jgi:poly-beta-1,6-N-acetyl-D-glucosamine biosynthesis protein PgaD
MTSLIINMPHLQSRRQRHGATFLSILCWAWFLMPLVIIAGWLMGFRAFAQEIVVLGGWKSLLRLGEFSTSMILTLIVMWTVWTLIDVRRSKPRLAPVAPAINAATALGADQAQVNGARGARLTTVHFTPNGSVAAIIVDPEAGRIPRRYTRARRAA